METLGGLLIILGMCLVPMKGVPDAYYGDEEGGPFFHDFRQFVMWVVCLILIAGGAWIAYLGDKA